MDRASHKGTEYDDECYYNLFTYLGPLYVSQMLLHLSQYRDCSISDVGIANVLRHILGRLTRIIRVMDPLRHVPEVFEVVFP
jgi:hypothetical protein